MAIILSDTSRTFSEYLLIPRLTRSDQKPELVDLSTPLSVIEGNESPKFKTNIPLVSASMQAVSGPDLAIALARQGGLSFIFCSQPIASQAEMIRQVKRHKAGFVPSDTNATEDMTLQEVITLMRSSGHSTVPVTSDGSPTGLLKGIITDRDFWEHEDDMSNKVKQHMTLIDDVIYGSDGISLRDANGLLHKHKKECLPVLSPQRHLVALVFKKDYEDHRRHPLELLDASKRLCVGAAINTHDYVDRVPALVEAGVDVICFDSSDGFNEHQMEGVRWIRNKFGKAITLGAGNIVSAEGFDYLVGHDLIDFVKVGIGGGSICITREQKGIGRGQASALMDIVQRRNSLAKETGRYIPICSDGGLSNDTQIVIALAMGADFVMMGRYFAMTDESPTPKTSINGQMYKPYWGEGTRRAQNWQRYSSSMESRQMIFEEGVDAYVPLVGPLSELVQTTLYKLRSTMVNVGADSLSEFREQAILTMVSEQSVEEAGTSNVRQFTSNRDADNSDWGNRG
ncbi:MAG: inosine 5-monophosphate dehydrogenase [Gammaproteobacteria bacterium]|nr:inosine 5-monophosphate dehydrogenase [Gammaproteobacteria bacterium]OUV68401.1 MAG: inosine 5-monophosphate dehydrogenase [Gammaproteobacteria bacterium TMED133]